MAFGGPAATQARVSCTDCDQLTHSSGFSASDEAMLFRVLTMKIVARLCLLRMMPEKSLNIRYEKNEYKEVQVCCYAGKICPHGRC